MNKSGVPLGFEPPPSAPPSYYQAVGGVPPSSPFTPCNQDLKGTGIVTTVVPVGPEKTHTICPHCRSEIDTTTVAKPGIIAYIASGILCLVGCFCGCCLIPFCMDGCMDIHHYCPVCDSYLGRFKR